MGTSKNGDSAKLECFQMLTQPRKFCTSVTKRCPLLFILLPLSSPFAPSPSERPPPPLSCLRASLNSDEDTLRGVGRDEGNVFLLLSSSPACTILSDSPSPLTGPLMSPLQPLRLLTFNAATSALRHLFPSSCRQGMPFFSLTGAALASNLSSGLM